MKDLSKRSTDQEIMDDFQGGTKELRAVFDDINRVNGILGGNSITVKAIAKLIEENPQNQYTIIDMGCGDGNMLREVAQYCRKKKIQARLIGIDLNKDALELAKEYSITYPEITYVQKDILEPDTAQFNCDILMTTLCMHHFTDSQLKIFLKKFTELVKIGVVINDLQRSRLAYYLFKVFRLIFIKTRIAKIDGLISISRGFIRSDLIRYAKSLPKVQHRITWKWAFRYVWIMQPDRLT